MSRSISPYPELQQFLQETLAGFDEGVTQAMASSTQTAKLHLTDMQLALYACWHRAQGERSLIIWPARGGSSRELLATLTAWQETLQPGPTWHLLTPTLTQQELEGEVTTTLSLAYHWLLQATPGHHALVVGMGQDTPVPDPSAYEELTQAVQVGQKLSIKDLSSLLLERGYVRYRNRVEPGGYCVRGEQLELIHPALSGRYTITWYGVTIERIVQQTNQRTHALPHLAIPPMRLPIASVPLARAVGGSLVYRPSNEGDFSGPSIIIDALQPQVSFPLRAVPRENINLVKLRALVAYTHRDLVTQQLQGSGCNSYYLYRSRLADLPLCLTTDTTSLMSEHSLCGSTTTPRPISRWRAFAQIAELRVGKPAVHADHGIGIYEGLEFRRIGNLEREYLIIRYAAGDSLSVPVEFAHKVTAYLGETTPVIHRLGGTLWSRTKRQARTDAVQFAKELLATSRQRAAVSRTPYAVSDSLETKLARSFPFALTPHQEQAWQEVQADLVLPQPMDRLIVGDVGFGKTEIAIRAARHVVESGRQVALLAPTTLLVQQHVDTFKSRLPDIAAQIGVLSRFVTVRAASKVRARLAAGTLTIGIGTHALVAARTTWRDLGLVIIDEEQRFGVKHKEFFKKLRASVDVLSLSATPIPRTLSMALSGLKELSIISTPPAGRQAIASYVGKDTDATLAKALHDELARGGQVYVVVPKIRHLPQAARRVQALVPDAQVAVAHGRLPAQRLSHIMQGFDAGQIQVLVSSTIIASGLDLPNANTLVVMHATHFGLAELYQLRGRVGRRERQGKAFFLYNQSELTGDQRQRLAALTEASRLGSGWALAQRDLEIRGAGNLLGAEQSGSVNAVGVQLYLDMVHDALEEPTTVSRQDVDIRLPLPASLPPHYIDDLEERTQAYQRLGRAPTLAALQTQVDSLAQSLGPLPPETKNLVLLLELQHVAAQSGIKEISSSAITPLDEDPYVRLTVRTGNVPATLVMLAPLGNWVVRDHALTLDTAAVTPEIVQKMISLGQQAPSAT